MNYLRRITLAAAACVCLGAWAQTADTVELHKTDGTVVSWPKSNVDSIVSTPTAQKVYLTIPLSQVSKGSLVPKKATDAQTYTAADLIGHKFTGHCYYENSTSTTGFVPYCMVYYFLDGGLCWYFKTYDMVNLSPTSDVTAINYTVSGTTLTLDNVAWTLTDGGQCMYYSASYGRNQLYTRAK